VEFQRGELVSVTWMECRLHLKMKRGPAIVIEAGTKSDGWIKVWIPARNGMMFTDASCLTALKHYNEARG